MAGGIPSRLLPRSRAGRCLGIISDLFRRLLGGRSRSASPTSGASVRDLDAKPKTRGPYLDRPEYLSGTIPVLSSFIISMRWAETSNKGELTIIMKSGTYTYVGVPEDVYDDFFASASKGVFYNNHIKGKYQLKN